MLQLAAYACARSKHKEAALLGVKCPGCILLHSRKQCKVCAVSASLSNGVLQRLSHKYGMMLVTVAATTPLTPLQAACLLSAGMPVI